MNNALEDLVILLCSLGVLIFAVFALDRAADYRRASGAETAVAVGVTCTRLLADTAGGETHMTDLMTRFGDSEEYIYSAELFLLRRIAETSSDMVKARHWDELREATGGQEKLNKAHEDAVNEYEQWMSDGVG